eukprot:TRINITY_DN39055_c0_g1_i1.p1 TRINITY_DN39055_c0_g1~~TRINITY_DN39055_c0_g1_i1.p1  ORF type:complete len:260 (+),score=-9.94 TRINITY_DN39055_c0_g1_i1:442-1221(+)
MALAIFDESLVELPCDVSYDAAQSLHGPDVLRRFMARHRTAVSLQAGKASLAYCHDGDDKLQRRQLAACGDAFCIFTGRLDNIPQLRRTYGVSGSHGHPPSEPQLLLEMYRALRDRAPFSAESALADFEGPFATIAYDHSCERVFIAADGDSHMRLFWGMCADRSIAVTDDVELIRTCCPTTWAPFPAGCLFSSAQGLLSFDSPGRSFHTEPHVDAEGRVCGCCFVLDSERAERDADVTCGLAAATIGHIGSGMDLTAI